MVDLLARTKLYSRLFCGSENMFRRLVEDNRAGVYIADADGNLMYVNSAFVSILGYSSRDELLGKNLAKELYVNPKEREYFLKAMEKTGFVRDYEVHNKRKDGSLALLSVTSNWIKDEAERIIGVEGIVHDITEKRKIEDAFKYERDKLEEVLAFEEGLSLIHDVQTLGRFAVDHIADVLKAQKCSLMLYDRATQELHIKAAKGLEESTIHHTHKMIGEPIAGLVAQKREPVLVVNIEYDKQYQQPNRPYYTTRSFMSAPVMFGPQLLGIINVADKLTISWQAFSDVDLKMLCAMSRAVGISLENAWLFERLEKLTEGEPWTSLRHRF